MDLKNYISSGILELYVLGDLNAAQRKEVEANAAKYPEIKAEIEAIEDALESMAQAAAVAPPAGMGLKILDLIDDKSPQASPSSTSASSAYADPVDYSTANNNIAQSAIYKKISFIIGALLLGTVIWGYMQTKKSKKYETELTEMTQQFEQLENDCANLKLKATHFAFLRDANTTPIVMEGTERSPSSSATVFWNKDQKKAYLDTGNMPTVPSDKQYQLWAIVDGKPVDMGVFDPITDDMIFIEVPFIEEPQAFAVTLEKLGGNPTPTMEEMYVLGSKT